MFADKAKKHKNIVINIIVLKPLFIIDVNFEFEFEVAEDDPRL